MPRLRWYHFQPWLTILGTVKIHIVARSTVPTNVGYVLWFYNFNNCQRLITLVLFSYIHIESVSRNTRQDCIRLESFSNSCHFFASLVLENIFLRQACFSSLVNCLFGCHHKRRNMASYLRCKFVYSDSLLFSRLFLHIHIILMWNKDICNISCFQWHRLNERQ